MGFTTIVEAQAYIHASLRYAPDTRNYRRWYQAKLGRLQTARDQTTAKKKSKLMLPAAFWRSEWNAND